MRDLTNYRFHRWTVVSRVGKGPQGINWLCRCDCGTEKEISAKRISFGKTKSCGCWNIDVLRKRSLRHGYASKDGNRRMYNIWLNVKQRCYNKKSTSYRNYGGRGIRMCSRWKESFNNFLSDMGECHDGMMIERIDNNGNYEPGNCRWATRAEQNRNQRRNRMITIDGETKCLLDWAKEYQIDHRSIWTRLKLGWPPKRAVMEPTRRLQRTGHLR